MDWVDSGSVCGTTGQGLRLEAIQFEYTGRGRIEARGHVQNKGWMGWTQAGGVIGTTGQALRLEALEFRFVSEGGARAPEFEVMVHLQNTGWTLPAGFDATIGTTGQARRLEAIRVKCAPVQPVLVRIEIREIGLRDKGPRAASTVFEYQGECPPPFEVHNGSVSFNPPGSLKAESVLSILLSWIGSVSSEIPGLPLF
jgi:hypothetical protein